MHLLLILSFGYHQFYSYKLLLHPKYLYVYWLNLSHCFHVGYFRHRMLRVLILRCLCKHIKAYVVMNR
ncbi:hypothetical protein COI_1735 [Mannheimia haemolytica serotype A2 str. OVINE]|nr:hypothetical protein COI_1735 [Mannheimia haemolytica serotype A2 str. OVINE]EEY12542.1 hypothetical protein COK_1379 [Mannheimia haemolytica serotype A2 str. BOVINE]